MQARKLWKTGQQPQVPLVAQVSFAGAQVGDAADAVQLQFIQPFVRFNGFMALGQQHGADAPVFKELHQCTPAS